MPPRSSFTGDFTTWSRSQSLVKERHQTIPVCWHWNPLGQKYLQTQWPVVDGIKPSLWTQCLSP
jgi:hypothetical protein